MKWFRFYSEVLHDPKVQRLAPELFKAWINILCIANEQTARGTLPPLPDIAWALRLSDEQAAVVLDQLCDAGLIDCDGDEPRIHGWDNRQYRSDDVTARVHKHRHSNKEGETLHETLMQRFSNAPRTDTDTEQIQSRTEESTASAAPTPLGAVPKPPKTSSVKTAPPDNINISPAMRQWAASKAPLVTDLEDATEQWLDWCRREGEKYSDWVAGWRNGMKKAQQFAEEARARRSNGAGARASTRRPLQVVSNGGGNKYTQNLPPGFNVESFDD